MPDPSKSDLPFDPKWFVFAGFAAIFLMVLYYDMMLGLVVGGIFSAIGAVTLYIQVRFAAEPGEPVSERGALVDRFRRIAQNRRLARNRELGPENGADAG